MKHLVRIFFCLCCASFLGSQVSWAQDMFIYPTKGQSAEQQDRDKWECRSWATNQTKFDPYNLPKAPTRGPAPPPQGGLVRGAGRGAALGAVGGAIAGDAGKGAAAGAAMGGMFGVMRRNDQIRQMQYEEEQQTAQIAGEYHQKRSEWTRALSACLQGRGYTVQ